ncbi:MAG: deoxynucleoside kinase [Gammaproteobacteria bacterium]|nr:deoxynucleoside kinase [Gammaproteobacteria bacterium]
MSVPSFIVVEGPVGVGKTTLSRRLAESFGSELLLEAPDKNPFLEKFYRKPRQHALPTQLFFLLQRAQQLQELRQSDLFNPVRVADFLMEKDRLFAQLTLDADELTLYNQVFEHLTIDAPKPDLVIYLQAPVQVLLTRIQRRGVHYEHWIQPGYLQRLVDSYTQFFYDYSEAPLLIVNAAEANFVESETDYQQLLDQIRKVRNGRHYFNPVSLTLS